MTMPWRRTLSASSTWHWHHHHHHHGHHHHHHHHRDHIDMVSDAHLLRGPVNLGLKSICLGKPEKELDWILASKQIIQMVQILKSDEQMLQSCGRIGFFKWPTLTNWNKGLWSKQESIYFWRCEPSYHFSATTFTPHPKPVHNHHQNHQNHPNNQNHQNHHPHLLLGNAINSRCVSIWTTGDCSEHSWATLPESRFLKWNNKIQI